jgi:hypothetical protein
MSAKKRLSIASPLGAGIALVVVLAAGAAFASTGVGSLVSQGDDGSVTARGAQGTLGDESGLSDQVAATPDDPGELNTLGERAAGNSGDDPSGKVPSGSGSGSGSSLPFTGFLAIPVLLAGIALLMSGLVTRWGSRKTAASA